MFHPTGLRINLFEFFLGKAFDIALMVKNQAAAAGSALIKGQHKMGHSRLFSQAVKLKEKTYKPLSGRTVFLSIS